jgi:ribosomal-protein-alanine N-acetyltransferase
MADKNFTPFPVLKTERLTLRQLISSDDKEIFALRSDDNVNKYLDRKPSKSIDDARNFIQTINENIQRNDSVYWYGLNLKFELCRLIMDILYSKLIQEYWHQ